MRIGEFLIDKIIAPLVVASLTPITISIISKINTGDWAELFGLIPKIFWVIFSISILAWIAIIVIHKRVKRLQELDSGPGVFVISQPIFGWVIIAKFNYVGLIWKVRAPATAPWESFDPSSISSSSIEIETPPRCPKCETEIEQEHSFWGGYIWRCVRCGFKKRNRDSYYREQERAEKIARREWEKQRQ